MIYVDYHLGASKAEPHELGILLSDVPLSCICGGSRHESIGMIMNTYNLVRQAAKYCFICSTNDSRRPLALLHSVKAFSED